VAGHSIGTHHAERRRGNPALPAGTLTLVVDGSTAVAAGLAGDGFATFQQERLVAPPLMWSEARSALHELLWRGEVAEEDALAARVQLDSGPVLPRTHRRLGVKAWRLADELGWAMPYDAEYVALASLLGCRLVTLDARLRRSCARLGFVVAPNEL